MSPAPSLIHYRIPGAGGNLFPGAHTSLQQGQGFMFREHDTLARSQEQKRIDIHASLRNPFGEIMVRTFNQKSAISIQAVVDMSASIVTPLQDGKMDTLKQIVESLAYSAFRYGDKFALVPCNDQIDPHQVMPLSGDISAIKGILSSLDRHAFTGGVAALPAAHQFLGRQRGLIFLISDFLFDRQLLAESLQSFGRQLIIPVVIRDGETGAEDSGTGMVAFRDAESGRKKYIFMRRSIRKQYKEKKTAYYLGLQDLFLQQGIRPLYVKGHFDPDQFSAYFFP